MCKHEIFHTTNSIEVESADIKSRWILDISMYGIIIFCFSGFVLNSVKEVSRFPSLGVHILFCFFSGFVSRMMLRLEGSLDVVWFVYIWFCHFFRVSPK